MVTRMGIPGSVGCSPLTPIVPAHRTRVQDEDRARDLPPLWSSLTADVELVPGWPVVPLVWAGGEEKLWGREGMGQHHSHARLGESWVPCPQRVPGLCSAVTSGLPSAWGSAREGTVSCRGPVSWSRWGWTDERTVPGGRGKGSQGPQVAWGGERRRGLQAGKGRGKPG